MISIPRITKEQQDILLSQKLDTRTNFAILTDPSHPEYLENQAIFLDLCKQDCKFFIDNCLWIQDPERSSDESKEIPFLLWDYQEHVIDNLVDAIEKGYDLSIDKCRKVGATWLILAVFLWFWHFHKSELLLGGRKLEDVDKRGDIGTLMGKLRFMISRLPAFVFPTKLNNFTDKVALLVHPEHGASIAGEGNNDNFGRSDRRKAVFLDEFSSWESTERSAYQGLSATTKCRITCSTPNRRGTNCFFYDIVQDNIKNNKPHIRIDWKLHPVFADGLRPSNDDDLAKTKFFLDETSPWLEAEIRRATDMTSVAQEILIDYQASMSNLVFPEWDSATQVHDDIEYDSSLPLYVGMDIGLDQTAMIWFQPYKNTIRVIDEYVNSDEDIYHFIEVAENKPYKTGIWYGDPWSGGSRNVTSKASPATILRQHGIIFKFKRTSQANFIQSGRTLLHRLQVSSRCTLFIEMMENWKMKAPRSGDTRTGLIPEHSVHSHTGTAYYYFCFNYSGHQNVGVKKQVRRFIPSKSGVIL